MQRICYTPLQLFSLFFDAFLKNAIGLDSRQTVEFIFLISEKKKICDFFCIIRKNRYIRPLKRQVFRQ